MNNIFYGHFSFSARYFGYTGAVAWCAGLAAFLSFFSTVFFALAAKLPITDEAIKLVTLLVFLAWSGHGLHFGALAFLKIRSPETNLRFINNCIDCTKYPKLRANLSTADLLKLLNLMIELPRKNGKVGFFWVALDAIVLGIYLPLRHDLPLIQFTMLGVAAVLGIFLHSAFTYIFSELAVARIVADCRGEILKSAPDFQSSVSFSLNTKFLILGGTFIASLFNLFSIMYVSHENLSSIFAILSFNVMVMLFLGYLVLYRISASLQEIRQAATNLKEGSNTLINSKSLDSEFVDIVDGLNSATLAIQDHQQNLENRIIERTKELSSERDKSDKLLLNILPPMIAEELKQSGSAKPVKFDEVTVIFTDFVGFTRIAERLKPEELIGELDKCFSYFDSVTERYKLEKLKTIGDAFMCAGGIPHANRTHAIDSALAALEIQAFMNQMKSIKEQQNFPYWELRLGMNTGELIAGVIGERKFAYDVWGDTVNTASRMESSGTAGYINISSSTYERIKYLFNCEYRGKVQAKNKGEIDMYYLIGIKPGYSVNSDGRTPNPRFLEIYQKLSAGYKIVSKKRP